MNIIHGDSAAGVFKQAFHVPGDKILVLTDELSCGPLGKFAGIEEWKKFRQEFWSKLGVDSTFSDFQRDLYENFNKLHRLRVERPANTYIYYQSF